MNISSFCKQPTVNITDEFGKNNVVSKHEVSKIKSTTTLKMLAESFLFIKSCCKLVLSSGSYSTWNGDNSRNLPRLLKQMVRAERLDLGDARPRSRRRTAHSVFSRQWQSGRPQPVQCTQPQLNCVQQLPIIMLSQLYVRSTELTYLLYWAYVPFNKTLTSTVQDTVTTLQH